MSESVHIDTYNILLIEDDPGDALLIREMLDSCCGRSSLAAASRLSEGISLLGKGDYNVVLLDMNLPDSSGIETLTTLLEAAPDVPVIVLTGLSDEAFGMDAIKCGAQDYLVKDETDSRILKRAVRYSIERKKLESDLKRANRLLALQASTDPLTGICNRLKLDSELDTEIARALRYDVPLCLIMFDIDHFKRINDTYGHNAGDRVLCEVAAAVSGNIRSTDWFGRWGGEEFMVLAAHKDINETAMFAEKLRGLVESLGIDGDLCVTASFGAARLRPGESKEALINRADEALYLAKHNGRNRVEAL